MPRAHDDDWDLASSVGATATMAATGRAMATKDPRGLIDDPFAEPLVRAVGVDFFNKIMDGEVDLDAIGSGSPVRLQSVVDLLAVRTKYFDDYLLAATGSGVRQVVILASGLDSRAYRLPWPAGAVIYEIDQPQVIDFKATTLAGIGAAPAATWRTIPIDLRQDWPAALKAAGLDTTAPTAWLAEGLLVYLPPEAQDLLLDNVTALSAPGSTIATEFMPGIKDFDASGVHGLSASLGDRNAEIDMASLVYSGERSHVPDYLGARGWDVEAVAQAELFARNGLEAPAPKPGDPLSEVVYISGGLTG